MICSKCGTPSPDSAKFCLRCGEGLASGAAATNSRPRRWWLWALGGCGAIVLLVAVGWLAARLLMTALDTQVDGASTTASRVLPPPGQEPSGTVVASSAGIPETPSSGAPTALLVPTATASPTPSPSPSITPSPTYTPSATPSPTPTRTPTLTPSVTPPPSRTPTPTSTATPSQAPTPTKTPKPTKTPVRYCFVGRVDRIEDQTYPHISIHGRVLDRRGRGVRRQGIRVWAYNWHVDVRTGGDGVFIVDGLAQPMEWNVTYLDRDITVQVPIDDGGQKGVVVFQEEPCR